MKGILKLNKKQSLNFQTMHFSQTGTEHWKNTHTKERSTSTKLNLNITDGVLIKHITVLWQVTKMQTASTFTILNKWRMHGPIKERTADYKMAPIHSYENCSIAQGKICFSIMGASHALVYDMPIAEIFSLFSIVSIVASWAKVLTTHPAATLIDKKST